jgi:hypothetical protein
MLVPCPASHLCRRRSPRRCAWGFVWPARSLPMPCASRPVAGPPLRLRAPTPLLHLRRAPPGARRDVEGGSLDRSAHACRGAAHHCVPARLGNGGPRGWRGRRRGRPRGRSRGVGAFAGCSWAPLGPGDARSRGFFGLLRAVLRLAASVHGGGVCRARAHRGVPGAELPAGRLDLCARRSSPDGDSPRALWPVAACAARGGGAAVRPALEAVPGRLATLARGLAACLATRLWRRATKPWRLGRLPRARRRARRAFTGVCLAPSFLAPRASSSAHTARARRGATCPHRESQSCRRPSDPSHQPAAVQVTRAISLPVTWSGAVRGQVASSHRPELHATMDKHFPHLFPARPAIPARLGEKTKPRTRHDVRARCEREPGGGIVKRGDENVRPRRARQAPRRDGRWGGDFVRRRRRSPAARAARGRCDHAPVVVPG